MTRVRIVRPCEVCGLPTKRPNARYCSGAHADVAYRRRREIAALCRQVDIHVAQVRLTTTRILELVTGERRAYVGMLPGLGEQNPTRTRALTPAEFDPRNQRDRPSPIGKE